MRKGDLVVVPSWGTFSIYELTEDMAISISEIELIDAKDWHGNKVVKKEDGALYRVTGENIDLGFVRKVKLIIKDIPRYEYADSALTSRMKIRSTNANISTVVRPSKPLSVLGLSVIICLLFYLSLSGCVWRFFIFLKGREIF